MLLAADVCGDAVLGYAVGLGSALDVVGVLMLRASCALCCSSLARLLEACLRLQELA